MHQCKFCNYTSVKKWNVQAHEKWKHSTQTVSDIVKIIKVNYKEIKIEEDPPSAPDTTTENNLLEILKKED